MSNRPNNIKNSPPQITAARSYEQGYAVETVWSKEGQSLTLNLANLHAPDKKYLADVADIEFNEATGSYSLTFGQIMRSGALRSVVELYMTPITANDSFNVINSLKNPSIDEIISAQGIVALPLFDFNQNEPPVGQYAKLRTHIIFPAVAGVEATLDFFETLVFSNVNSISGRAGNLRIAPVIRVQLPTGLLVSLVQKFKKIYVAPNVVSKESENE